ncbi:glycosyltransferase family 2 protein [Streptococcus suis]|uniref:glycosyltransferase family 2 protein n=1 Tax=Streptococcus suis TaxID=1307 RepID=UPI00041C4846|nr:glycosyltransferase family 2 protein [Streptococcus suis]MBL6514347.1 glycosyltransferase family 2 protein [Streptococcus suis]
MKFSVIIPAYNVADYLEECVYSVLNQTYEEFEILLVDDGSTDGITSNICDKLAAKDDRVKVFHQSNGGQSIARNTGIENASGDYILFLDGDDFWTDVHFLDEINDELHSHEEVVDAVIYPFSYWYGNADIRVRDFPQKLPRHEIITDSVLLVETGALIAPVWNKCVRRELFADSLMFPDGLMYEDGIWCADLLKIITCCCVIENSNYMYRQNRDGSFTNKITQKKVYHAFRGIEENLKNFKQLSNEKQEALLIYLSNSYISILPFVFPYLNNSDIKMFVKKFRYLLKYSHRVELVSFRISGLMTRVLGIYVSTFIQNKLLKIYKSR